MKTQKERTYNAQKRFIILNAIILAAMIVSATIIVVYLIK